MVSIVVDRRITVVSDLTLLCINYQLQNELGWFEPRRTGPFSSSIVSALRRDSFWLFVISRGGGLAKHLFHGF